MNSADATTAGRAGPGAPGVPYLAEIGDGLLDADLVRDVPVEWARTQRLLPVRYQGRVHALTADPSNIRAQDDLALLLGFDLPPLAAPAAAVAAAIERCYYRRERSPGDFMADLAAPDAGTAAPVSAADDLLQMASQAPVTQLVNLILLEAVKRDASDIHFEPFESRFRVRYRVDGVLYEQASPPKAMEQALVSRLKVMAHMDISERRLPQDGMARVRVGEREIDVRVSTVPVADGERVVLRLLNRDSTLLPLEALGMPEGARQAFEAQLRLPNGMIVVSGPTGSGKTTTLYAALSQLDAARRNILTIEDPIEYKLPGIGQIQVKPKIGLTFAEGLRHMLRQDPDVVLVGETRDPETAGIAVRAALTGHLVFTTLHTNDAPSAVPRLVDMGVEPYLLASCLRAVVAQRLVRRLCGRCRKPVPAGTAALSEAWRRAVAEAAPAGTWAAAGCPACLEGYRGRVGLFECLIVDGEIEDWIRNGRADARGLRERAERAGMRGIAADGLRKAAEGLTSLAEVLDAVGPPPRVEPAAGATARA